MITLKSVRKILYRKDEKNGLKNGSVWGGNPESLPQGLHSSGRCILSTILRQALQVAGDSTTRTIMICIALVTGSALSLGFFAVYRHLKRNKDVIYKEDLENLKLQKKDA